jgi:anti-sigma factor RsiW
MEGAVECKEAGMLVHSYFDGELDARLAGELEAHALGCRSCAEELAGLERLRRLIRDEAPAFRAPPALRERLESEIARRGRRGDLPQPDRRRWLAIAASLAITAVGSSVITRWMVGAPERHAAGGGLTGDLVSSHLRALAASSPVDVVSTDQHIVKPWFNGRIGVAPPVVDLAERGFPLAGGRIDYVGGRRVAVVVYTRRRHVIDVFVLPEEHDTEASGTSHAESLASDGYTLLRRRWAGLTLWLVSDLNPAELGQFADWLTAGW